GRMYMEVRNASGTLVDQAKVEAAEQTAKLAKYGKVDRGLAARLSTMGASQRTAVSIWVNAPDPTIARTVSLQSRLAAVQRVVSPYRQGVLKALAHMGVSAWEPQYGPAVFAKLTPGQIRSIAKRSDVNMVYGPTANSLDNDDATTTEHANDVWAM